jgi:hypothetical protein
VKARHFEGLDQREGGYVDLRTRHEKLILYHHTGTDTEETVTLSIHRRIHLF